VADLNDQVGPDGLIAAGAALSGVSAPRAGRLIQKEIAVASRRFCMATMIA
jgi:hypothetical protein